MTDQRELERIKEALPPEIFEKFRPEFEMSQGKMLRVWLWRMFLMCILPWRWKILADMIRSAKENKRYWSEQRRR